MGPVRQLPPGITSQASLMSKLRANRLSRPLSPNSQWVWLSMHHRCGSNSTNQESSRGSARATSTMVFWLWDLVPSRERISSEWRTHGALLGETVDTLTWPDLRTEMDNAVSMIRPHSHNEFNIKKWRGCLNDRLMIHSYLISWTELMFSSVFSQNCISTLCWPPPYWSHV